MNCTLRLRVLASTSCRQRALAAARPPPPRAAPHQRRCASATAAAFRGDGAAAGGGGDDHRPPTTTGRVEIITGPMFSGKSTELLRRVAEHRSLGRTVALVSSSRDTRYAAASVATHAGAAAPALAVAALADLPPAALAAADVVAVDEAQFFDDLIPFVTAAADGRGQTVIVAGLDGDFARRPFGALLALVPHAETVTRLAASCAWCGADAAFSVRVKGGAAGETVVVGGAESYAPACRAHYHAAATLPPPPPPLGGAAVAAPSLGAGAEAAGRAGVGQ